MAQSVQDLDLFSPLDGKSTEDIAGANSNAGLGIKVKRNAHGLLEISRNPSTTSSVATSSVGMAESDGSSSSDSEESDSIDLTCRETALDLKEGSGSSPETAAANATSKPKVRDDEILCCQGCGCYGMAGEFLNAQACGEACQQSILQKNRERARKERELMVQRQRRETRKRELLLAKEEERKRLKEESEAAAKSKQTPVESEEDDMGDDTEDDTGFAWGRYLDATNAKGAPSKFFETCIPSVSNPFKVGMKLEAKDPQHPSLFCCVSIVEVKAYRIRLHFDGFTSSYDFWVNADSLDIYQAGWCEQQRQELQVPPTYLGSLPFTWKKYMSQQGCKGSVIAPRSSFHDKPKILASETSGWQIGSKLEAIDKQNTALICVATVKNILQGKLLIHFDGWELDYDYWVKSDSPYVKPRGYCDKRGLTLNKPKGYKGDFKWDRYLNETNSKAVPEYAFKPRSSNNTLFRRGMKLEAVDIRNAMHIRVATVADTSGSQIKIHYDGWPENYDYWFDDSSTELYPPTWCSKTGHQLMPPLTTREVKRLSAKSECQTPGCGGFGHVKGHLYSTHNSLVDCPYAPKNIHSNESIIPDRLLQLGKTGDVSRSNRKRKRTKFFDDPEAIEEKEESLIRGEVFRPPHVPEQAESVVEQAKPLNWKKNVSFLSKRAKIPPVSQVQQWSSRQVAEFVSPFVDSIEHANRMIDEEVDGEAFLMLTQSDLIKVLGLRLGPSLKIVNSLLLIKSCNANYD